MAGQTSLHNTSIAGCLTSTQDGITSSCRLNVYRTVQFYTEDPAALIYNSAAYTGSHETFSYLLDGVNASRDHQENALFVNAYVPSTSAASSYQKNAIMAVVTTADVSDPLGGLSKDAVGIAGFAYVADGNLQGVAFGSNFVCKLTSLADGTCSAAEFNSVNERGFRPKKNTGEYDRTGLNIISQGAYPSTVAVKIGGTGWHKMLYTTQSSIYSADTNSSFIEIASATDDFGTTSVYRVGRNGYTHIGTTSTAPAVPYGVSDTGGTCDGVSNVHYCGAPTSSAIAFIAGVSSTVPFAGSSTSASSFDLLAGGLQVVRLNKGSSTGTQYLGLTPGASGTQYTIQPAGTDSNIPLVISSKGTGSFIAAVNQKTVVTFASVGASSVNSILIQDAIAAGTPKIQVQGSDTNIGFLVAPKGSGGFTVTSGSGTMLTCTFAAGCTVGDMTATRFLGQAGSGVMTSATTGFFFISTSAGTPSGTPASIPAGYLPCLYDTTNNKHCCYNAGWKCSAAYS